MATSDEISELDPIDEELVAYLDGELESTQRIAVERRLADNDAYRERLRQLQQSWEALDLLPRTVAGDAFTSTTVALVVAQEEVAATQALKQIQVRRNFFWVWVALGSLAAAAVGFLMVYRSMTAEDSALIRDLPVIERVDRLHNTPSIEFLQQLRDQQLFAPEKSSDQP